jgi:hypothetical protein
MAITIIKWYILCILKKRCDKNHIVVLGCFHIHMQIIS